jgi:hypothetical protein
MLRKCMIPLCSVVGLVLALSHPIEAREVGSQIDPNGGRRGVARISTLGRLATASEGERGSNIDPDGGRSLATASEGEIGSHIDPNGGRSLATSEGKIGSSIDPNG